MKVSSYERKKLPDVISEHILEQCLKGEPKLLNEEDNSAK